MQDDIFYKMLHDEILSNNTRITNLQYWSVFLGVAVLGFLKIQGANPIAAAALLTFVSLMTFLLFISVYSTGISSLRIGAYLLALERKHNQDRGWEHFLQEERSKWKKIMSWGFWRRLRAFWRQFLDVQVFLQLAYLVVIGYFACTSRESACWVAGGLIFVFFMFIGTLMVIWTHAESLQYHSSDAKAIDKWMNKKKELHYMPRPWYHKIIE